MAIEPNLGRGDPGGKTVLQWHDGAHFIAERM